MAERFASDEVDNLDNKWWKNVRALMKKQESLIVKMATINNQAIHTSQGGSNKTPTSNIDISVSNHSKDVEVTSDPTNDPKLMTTSSSLTDDFFECTDQS